MSLWKINIDPENHPIFRGNMRKLIFQALSGRVYVDLLEGKCYTLGIFKW